MKCRLFNIVLLAAGCIVLNAPSAAAALAHYWSLDGADDTSPDVGGAVYNAASSTGVETSTTDRFGRVSQAMHFADDDRGLFYNIPDGQRIDDLGPSFTVSAWVKSDTLGGNGGFDRIIEGDFTKDFYLGVYGASGTTGSQSYLAIANNTVYNTDADVKGGSITTAWQLVTMTYNAGTVNLYLYVDGALVDTGVGNAPEEFSVLTIGSNDTSTGEDWKGSIDDVSIWSGALTPAEVAALYSLSASSSVMYTPQQADSLFNLYDATESGTIDGIIWTYTTGLAGTPGQLLASGQNLTLVMNDGNGFLGYIIPEPASLTLLGMAGLAMLKRRGRR